MGWVSACPPVIRRLRQRPLYVCLLSQELSCSSSHPPPAPPHVTLPDTHVVTLVILLVLTSSIEQELFI